VRLTSDDRALICALQFEKHGERQLVYRRRHFREVEHLKEILQTCWKQIGQDVINCLIGQFHKRLSPIFATSEGHTEHCFD